MKDHLHDEGSPSSPSSLENVLINEENMPRRWKKFFEEHRGED